MSSVVLICGDRNWNNYDAIEKEVSALPSDTLVIHGNCNGADKLGGHCAYTNDLKVKIFPADWERHGKAAGPKRNQQMLDYLVSERINGKTVSALAFHPNISGSKGTKDMLNKLRLQNITYKLIEG